ncbi:hypothetical protein GCM10010201_36390 [Pilimelia columellifera subsp. columellifera]|uniref:Uncharacterized protein n=1 Tax=Pilimelia columellifera subsp. columellifera TaxID=706583 RepID=A0ABP6B2H8_9ACTN
MGPTHLLRSATANQILPAAAFRRWLPWTWPASKAPHTTTDASNDSAIHYGHSNLRFI